MKQIYYAIQNIIRGKDSTIIKVVSLSLGLFVSIILFARVALELSYDTFYQNPEQLYLVQTSWDYKNGKGKPSLYNIYPTGETLVRHFPKQVVSSTVIYSFIGKTLKHGSQKFQADLVMADSAFFQTLGIPLLRGKALDLNTPDALFLSESLAREIFGDDEPVGKTLLWTGEKEVVVRGIFADVPENVSINTNAILSISGLTNRKDWNSGGNFLTMIRLKEGADADFINQRTATVFANYLPINDHYGQYGVIGIDISITPLVGFHLKESKTTTMICIMTLLGCLLLFASAFNYALISISSLSHRAKVIGVHKCSGAEAWNIFGMFLWETLFVVGVAILVVVFLILNFSEVIEELTDATVAGMFCWKNLWAPSIAIVLLFLIGCILPGRLFSTIPVTQVFRRYTQNKKRWKYPLLFVQFMGTAFLLCFVALIYFQHRYVLNKDLGWNSERLVYAHHSFANPLNGLSNLRNLPYVEGAENSFHLLLEAPLNVRWYTADSQFVIIYVCTFFVIN